MECIRSQAFLVVRCQTVGLHPLPHVQRRCLPVLICSRIRAVQRSAFYNENHHEIRTDIELSRRLTRSLVASSRLLPCGAAEVAMKGVPCGRHGQYVLFFITASCLLFGAAAREGTVMAADDFGVKDAQQWRLVGSGFADEGLRREGRRIVGADKNRDEGKNTWWFASPTDFVGGDAALVYNSWLTYTLGHFEYEDLGQGVMEGYDVMLISTRKKFSIGLKGVFSPPEDSLAASYEVRMDETFTPNNGTSYWELVTGKVAGKRVTKHDFVQCLSYLSEIRIRGAYFKGTEATWLKDVKVIEGLADKGGRYPGMMLADQPDGGPEYEVVNGVKVYRARSAAPQAAECCASKTCVGRDRFELVFDRPGWCLSRVFVCETLLLDTSVTVRAVPRSLWRLTPAPPELILDCPGWCSILTRVAPMRLWQGVCTQTTCSALRQPPLRRTRTPTPPPSSKAQISTKAASLSRQKPPRHARRWYCMCLEWMCVCAWMDVCTCM